MNKPRWKPDTDLETRLYAFAEQHSRAEIIDRLSLTKEQMDAEKADLFFENRTFITEVKSLSTDTSQKVHAILAPYESTEDWPLFYGTRDIGDILPKLPNSDELRKKLYEAVSSAIPELVRKANRQIRSTRRTFDLPESKGLLIILNDAVAILNPQVISRRVGATLAKKTPRGELQFPEIAGVWILSEQHTVHVTPTLWGIPAVVFLAPNHEDDALTDEFLRRIQGFWATFNGLPLVRLDSDRFDDLKYTDAVGNENGPVTRSEHWRREYHARPYLRSLDEESLLAYGAKLTAEIGNMFLKGSRSTHEARIRTGQRFGDFMEEFNARKLDLRILGPYNRAANIYFPASIHDREGQEESPLGDARNAEPSPPGE
jgi:hypothetical protein